MNDPDAGRWLLSTACPVRRRVWNLQSPVRGRVLAHCWALRNQAPPLTFGSVGLNLQCLLGPDTFVVEGRGGRVVCELDSGREHLPMPLHQEVSDF